MFICIASSSQFRYNLRIRLCLYTIFRNHAANIVISLFIAKYRVKYLNIFSYCNRKIGIKKIRTAQRAMRILIFNKASNNHVHRLLSHLEYGGTNA